MSFTKLVKLTALIEVKSMSVKLLEMKNIHKRFPGVYALNGVNFELEAGEVHALLGENGAGKSTLMKVLGGIYSVDEGKIFINGKEAKIQTVNDAKELGISIIHQEIALVPYLSVYENVFLGSELMKNFVFMNKETMIARTKEMLDEFQLNVDPTTPVYKLTIAQQQMVEIIKAISYQAKILVMDEPTSSLSDKEVEFLFKTIRNLKKQGVGIIYISHKLEELFEISDRITVLRDGLYINTVKTKETNEKELISMMVGRELKNYYVRDYNAKDEVVLTVKNLNKKGVLKNISFSLRKGEILGFSGLVGAGRTELMKCIFGLDSFDEGEIFIENQKVILNSPAESIKHGIVYVPEDRKQEGLFLIQPVKYNTSLLVLNQFIKNFRVNHKYEDELVEGFIKELDIKTPSMDHLVNNLSGGNQQKVLIAKFLATKPKILILDEPTRGVDVGAKAEIYAIMNKLVNEDVSIIMISSELPEIINMSDRIAVMHNGTIQKILDKEDFDQEKIMHYATGGK